MKIKAKFSQATKKKILNRDKVCIISWNPITDYHHSYYWAIQSNYWPSRNDIDQWVWLSAKVHRIIHHASPKEIQKSKTYRAKCILYLQELYK